MSVLDNLTRHAGKLANDVQASLKRARVEGERRLLQRRHRSALEELGERTYELVRSGELPEEPVAAEVAAIESTLMELEAKVAEIEALRDDDADEGHPAADHDDPRPATSGDPSTATSASTANGQGEPPPSGRGAGWDAADRFFRPKS